jgi:hypothetical protein
MIARWCIPALPLLAILALSAPDPGVAHEDEKHDDGAAAPEAPVTAEEADGHKPIDVRLVMPVMDSERGMSLFIEKGRVTCHSVNGVGGHDEGQGPGHDKEKA